MRPKYATSGITLARTPVAESSLFVHLLTPDLGLVRARVQGVRAPHAKLSAAIQTLAESDVMLVRGKEGWRLPNAVLAENRFATLSIDARARAGRVSSLLLRLVHGETSEPELYEIFQGLLCVLPELEEPDADAAECLAALRIVRALGLDAGEIPPGGYERTALDAVRADRTNIISRINRGLTASGL